MAVTKPSHFPACDVGEKIIRLPIQHLPVWLRLTSLCGFEYGNAADADDDAGVSNEFFFANVRNCFCLFDELEFVRNRKVR